MFELLIIAVVVLGSLYWAKAGENKELKYQLDLKNRISRYNSLAASERLENVREWIKLHDNLRMKIQAIRDQSYDAWEKRDESFTGRIYNNCGKLFQTPGARPLASFSSDEVEAWILHKLLNCIDLPKGLEAARKI